MRVRSCAFFDHQLLPAAPGHEAGDQANWSFPKGTFLEVRIFCYRGDATNQDAIQTMKMHLSEVCSVHITFGMFQAAVNDLGIFSASDLQASYVRAVCDMRPVVYGTGSELYNIILKELASVGCRDWMSPALDSNSAVSVFAFVLDQGPDNQAATRFIRSLLVEKLNVMIVVVWCFTHQYHIIVKNMLLILNSWTWTEAASPASPYFAGLATVSNCWRSPGHPIKIYEKTCQLFGDPAGLEFAKKLPSKAVRGRWLAC
jgi:hypothetical protein